jgi:hypothetical protein
VATETTLCIPFLYTRTRDKRKVTRKISFPSRLETVGRSPRLLLCLPRLRYSDLSSQSRKFTIRLQEYAIYRALHVPSVITFCSTLYAASRLCSRRDLRLPRWFKNGKSQDRPLACTKPPDNSLSQGRRKSFCCRGKKHRFSWSVAVSIFQYWQPC